VGVPSLFERPLAFFGERPRVTPPSPLVARRLGFVQFAADRRSQTQKQAHAQTQTQAHAQTRPKGERRSRCVRERNRGGAHPHSIPALGFSVGANLTELV
jgi:hypothetical protein